MNKNLLLLLLPVLVSSCGSKILIVKKERSTRPIVETPRPETSKKEIPSENVLIKKYTALEYIDRFKNIAIAEMNEYGIPASITLAQGLLESGSGNSTLAKEANNHFGIKCTAEWKGKTILQDDDAKNDCFRVYKSPEESFRDHSEFLLRKRYASLFELNKDDYEGWASGLKLAGYATNPKYSELLVSLVERYQLNQYDRKESKIEKIKREDKVFTEINDNIPSESKLEIGKATVAMKIHEIKAGDTLYSLSKRYGLTVEEIKIINNLQSENLKAGQLLLVSK
jgi:LysM repeat protein